MGYDSDFDVTNFKGDKIQFRYKKEGEEEYTEAEVTYEEMQKTLAEHAVETEDAIIKYATRVNNTISALNDSQNALGEGIGSFLSEGNLDYAILTEE
jgi:hypothetical protein